MFFKYKKYLIFSIVCLIGYTNHYILSQTPSPTISPLELAKKWEDKAGDFQGIAEYDSALVYLKKAQKLYKKHKFTLHYIDCFNSIAVNYSLSEQYEKTLHYAEKVIQAIRNEPSINDSILAKAYQQKAEIFTALGKPDSAIYFFRAANKHYATAKKWEDYAFTHIGTAVNHFHLAQYAQMEEELKKVIAIVQKQLSEKNQAQAIAYELLAVLYESTGNYDKALNTAHESLKKRWTLSQISREDSFFIVNNYNNIGGIYLAKGDYNQAIEYYNQSITLQQKLDFNSSELMPIYNNLALAYKITNRSPQSFHYLYKNLLLSQTSKKIPNIKSSVLTYNHFASFFLTTENTDSALYYLHKALKLHQTDSVEIETTYRNIGLAYKLKKDYFAALDNFRLALKASVSKYGHKGRDVSIMYRYIGEIHALQKDFTNALSHLQKALETTSNNLDQTIIYKNPSLEQIFDRVSALKALVLKARTFLQYYEQVTCNPKDLEMAHNTYQLAAELIEVLKQEFIAEGSKEFLVGNATAVYEGLIYTSLLLQEQENFADKKSTDYTNAAFGFAEKGKATLLLAALKNAEAITFAQLPDSILNQETELKRDLAFYQRKLYEEKNTSNSDSLKMATWKQLVFDLKRKQEQLQANLKHNYSNYFQLQYSATTSNIPQIQQELLTSNKALLEYFVGDSTIYVFAITQHTTQIHTIPKTPHFLKNVTQLQETLNTPPIKTVDKQVAYQQYVQAAHFLYQQLLAPPMESFPNEITELILVADGMLGYIPFETLLTTLPNSEKPNYTLQNLNYLLTDYSINYAYSATLLLTANNMTSNTTPETFGGFAPQFATNALAENRDCIAEDLANLAHNQTEIETIQEQIGGLTFTGTTASSQFFMEQADQYQILHLATHACVNDEDPLFSKIFFSDTYLALTDIYNLRLNADLVVLSACNTGTGKLVNGEGIMSLSRGFMYANCPSVVTSLWQVNDRITADLMETFYQKLEEGFSKSEALRQAKLTHLQNSTNKFAAPYYWAAFVQLGNSQPIFETVNWWFWGLIGGMTLVGIGLFFKRNRSYKFL